MVPILQYFYIHVTVLATPKLHPPSKETLMNVTIEVLMEKEGNNWSTWNLLLLKRGPYREATVCMRTSGKWSSKSHIFLDISSLKVKIKD